MNKILLIEDSKSVAFLVMEVFRNDNSELNTEVVHKETLAKGIAAVSNGLEHGFDLVLLDLTLPDSTGLDTVTRFREANNHIPIVVLTGVDDEEIGLNAMRIGADDYLIKDETYPKLLRRHASFAIQRKSYDVVLRKAMDEAIDATKLKDKFISMVMHDIRSPLMGISGWAELLTKFADESNYEKVKEAATYITSSAEGMKKVLEEFLDISRLKTGKLTVNKGFIDAHFLSTEIVERLKIIGAEKGVTLTNDVPFESRLFTDPVLFGQVLQNLLTNAIKFSKRGDSIRIFIPPGQPSTIAVSDEGVGIPKDDLPRLFIFEEKVTTLGTEGEKGTGFGLPYSNDIMKSLGGKLRIESEEGKGSTFFASIPEVTPRVLIVDDEEVSRNILRLNVERVGAEVIEFADGDQALKFLEGDNNIHLILLDIIMSPLGGLELIKMLKKDDTLAQIPVIMVTGEENRAERDSVFHLGARDFILKPILRNDIIPRIRRIIA